MMDDMTIPQASIDLADFLNRHPEGIPFEEGEGWPFTGKATWVLDGIVSVCDHYGFGAKEIARAVPRFRLTGHFYEAAEVL